MHLGFTEILIILAVVLLLFGARRIPELARSLGKASSEFKKGKEESTSENGENNNNSALKTEGNNPNSSHDA